MPAINPGAGASNGPQQHQRTTFRPPWVKEGPEPLPLPSAPWTLNRSRQRAPEAQDTAPVKPNLKPVPRKNSTTATTAADNSSNSSSGPSGATNSESAPVRRTSKITIIPSRPSVDAATPKENGYVASSTDTANSRSNNSRTQQAATDRKSSNSQAPQVKEIPIEIKSTTKPKQEEQKHKSSSKQHEEQKHKSSNKQHEEQKHKSSSKQQEEQKHKSSNKQQEEQKPKSSNKQQEEQKPKLSNKQQEAPKHNDTVQSAVPQPPAPTMPQSAVPQPPAPPMPPPPMPGLERKPMSENKTEKLETLKNRPRKRPDWGALMKEVEYGNRKLKHVQCNDRSSPLLPKVKVKDRFMYESEKPNVHNLLLKEIQSGIRLKKVQTNDRSRPQLDGLRKFRRQMTIEEQIQKAETEEREAEPDELDDIDKVRDDLQSTKQMLALELRNKEAMERENKKLLTRILNLEVQLEKECAAKQVTEEDSPQARRQEEEQEKQKLKKQMEEVQRSAEEMEMKYVDTAGQLDMVRADLEEALRKNEALEKKLQASLLNQDKGSEQPLRKQPSSKKLAAAAKASNTNMQKALEQQPKEEEYEEEEEEEDEETETETESSSEEENTEALQERRMLRELKLLSTKLKSFKEKEEVARKERWSLRDQLKKQQKMLSEEKKKYKVLQKEVDKMANLMKEDDEEASDEDAEAEESDESESESESEESEEEESDGDLPPDTPVEKRKQNLSERAKRHENCLGALRKGNYLLKANIDRIKDDLFKQKEMSLQLQEDLNSVLAELG